MSVLIFGATGLIGKHITNALLEAKSNFNKIGIFTSAGSVERKAEVFDDFKAKGAEVITGDIQNEQDVLNAYKGLSDNSKLFHIPLLPWARLIDRADYDTIVSALGRDAIAMQVNLVRLAEQSGTINRFLPSEFGTDIAYSEASTHEPVHQEKLKVRAAFKNYAKRLEHTYLMVGPYPDYYFGMGAIPPPQQIGSYDAKAKKAYLLTPVDQKISWTAMPDVGKFVVAALLHPDVSRNRALKVQSFIASHADVLAEFEKQTDSKWDAEYTSPEQLQQFEDQAWSQNTWAKFTCSLRRLWMRGETLYPEWNNAALGDPPTMTLADVVAGAIAKAKQ